MQAFSSRAPRRGWTHALSIFEKKTTISKPRTSSARPRSTMTSPTKHQGNRHETRSRPCRPAPLPGRPAGMGRVSRARDHVDRARRRRRQCRHHRPPGRPGNEQAAGPARGGREPRRRRPYRHPGLGSRAGRRLHHRLRPRRHTGPASLPVQATALRSGPRPGAHRPGHRDAQRHRGQRRVALPRPEELHRRQPRPTRQADHDLGGPRHHQRSRRQAVRRADGRGGAPDSTRPRRRSCRTCRADTSIR